MGTRRSARDRRLCRPGDCADLDTTRVAQRKIPTRDIGTILFGCLAALLRLGAIAGRSTCFLLRDPRRQEWGETLARMRFTFRPAVRYFARQLAIPHFGSVRARARPLGLCRPRRPATLFRRAVQERHRHNHEVGTIGAHRGLLVLRCRDRRSGRLGCRQEPWEELDSADRSPSACVSTRTTTVAARLCSWPIFLARCSCLRPAARSRGQGGAPGWTNDLMGR